MGLIAAAVVYQYSGNPMANTNTNTNTTNQPLQSEVLVTINSDSYYHTVTANGTPAADSDPTHISFTPTPAHYTPAQFSLQAVLNRVPAAALIAVISGNVKGNLLVCVRQAVLDTALQSDEIVFAGERLCASWGWPSANTAKAHGGLMFVRGNAADTEEALTGWRVRDQHDVVNVDNVYDGWSDALAKIKSYRWRQVHVSWA